MTTYVGLLRGINVGGRRKVPMAQLRELAEDLGLDGVRTYIASGNLIFGSTRSAAALTAELASAIAGEFGFDVEVLVVDQASLQKALDSNPFPGGDPKQTVITFLSRPLVAAELDTLRAVASEAERIEPGTRRARWLYVDYAGGMGRSKLAGKLHSAGDDLIATNRNIATVTAILELMGGTADESRGR